MNVIIFGANGMLGRYLTKYLQPKYNVIKMTRKNLNISSASISDLENLISNIKCDYIINASGLIPQRGTKDIYQYIKINTLFPQWIALLSEKYSYKFIHITTDCVYSGERGLYSEDDIGDETNIYGVTKYLGENEKCCIIRTSIIGEEVKNKKSLLEWVKSNTGKEINGYINHFWNGVTCLELAKCIDTMIKNNIYWYGVRHIHSNTVSKYELIDIINDIYKLDIKIKKYSTDTVDKSLTSKYVIFTIPELTEQIKELKEFNIY